MQNFVLRFCKQIHLWVLMFTRLFLRIVLYSILVFNLVLATGQRAQLDTLIARAKEVYYASPDSSMKMGREILRRSQDLSYQKGRFEGLRLIGNSHFLLGRLDSAAYYMLRLLDQAYEANDRGMQADVMIDIGQTYDKIGLHSLAHDYFQQAHQIRLQTGDPERLSITFINLAYHYYLRDKLDSALHYYHETKIILDTLPLNYTKPFLYNELGGVYIKQGKMTLAREYIDKAIELNIKLNNNWDLAYNYVMLANLELKENNISPAEKYAKKALNISDESNIAIEYDLIYKILADVHTLQGNYSQALDYLTKSYSYADSLDMATADQKVLALNHYKKQKENEIATLKLKNENIAQTSRLNDQQYILIGVLLLLLVTVIAVGLLIVQNRKLRNAQNKSKDQNVDLKSLNSIKNKLFSIITHDIRNPLSNINGMLQLARDGLITNEEFNQYAGSLVDQTDRLAILTETLINWSKSQQTGLRASLEKVDLNKLIRQSIQYVGYMAENKEINLSYKENAAGPVKADPNMLMLVLNNLLTNAIKFTPKKGKVKIQVSEKERSVDISIKDTGIGIETDLLNKLKKRKIQSTPGTDNEKGTGIGLMLTMDLVAFNNGTLKAENNSTEGSTFHVILPKDE